MYEQQLQLHKSISDIWKDNYVVPLYQRNFAWAEEQIGQLLQDIYDHHEDCNCNYYLGSLVVLYRPKDGLYEVIDGQQRLTALQIICMELGILKESKLRYDSRPEVEDLFKALFNSKSCKDCYNNLRSKNSKTHRLIDALNIVASTKIRTKDGEVSLEDCSQELRKKMASYLSNNVMLIRVPLPLDTDVAAYFEIMNNRGQQLQAHEVIKALIMGHPGLDARQREVIATVWDACSQMDIPIQSSLSAYRTNNTIGKLFGDDYDSLRVKLLDKYNAHAVDEKILTIDGILGDTLATTTQRDEQHQYRYKSIIDFPNFLTHVFKMYDDQVELNGDNLAREYGKISEQIEPMKFISTLLTLRTLFDRYVVRVQAEDEEDEDLTWVLQKPYLSSGNTLKYKNTFSGTNDDIDDKTEDIASQKRIVKQLSMLQVSFRNRKYKRWLFDYLKWLKDNYSENINAVPSCAIEQYLDNWIESYYQKHIKESYIDNNHQNALFRLGVDTPHFLFNFIDYLYWLGHLQGKTNIRYVDVVEDFKFRYYNSVEHHRPQSYNNENVNIDSIGNLCLISRRSNSSLNDKDAREKAKIENKKLQPKRKIMYKITQEDDWGKKQIEKHEEDIKQLLANRSELLKVHDSENKL